MLLGIMGMFSTSAFAVLATDIFMGAVNVGITQKLKNIKNNIKCIDDAGVDVECTLNGTVRTLAPYAEVEAHWPTDDEFADAQTVKVEKDSTLEIYPGIYKSIKVEKAGKKRSNPGKLIMNPGVYMIDEYVVEGQVLPGDATGADPEGTVTILVKSALELTGSYNNCNIGSRRTKSAPYSSPNRYVVYTEDTAATVDDVCMSGYIYFKEALKIGSMDLWGAISAETMTLKKRATVNVNVDLEHLIFADFGAFLEVGPNISKGWHMVKAPAEISATNVVTIADFFGDDLDTSTFGTEWVVYQRDYDSVTHKSYYTELTELTTPLEKNRGYWLGLTKDADLKVLGLDPVVWDKKIKGCTSKHGCTRYTLQSCSAGDTNPSLYNLVGAVSSRETDWADYRVEVDNNGIVMTPSEAYHANIINKQIWKYIPNGSLDSANAGEYQTADDTGLLGDSTIDYFNGFWVEVNCTNSIGKTIDLIVPNRK